MHKNEAESLRLKYYNPTQELIDLVSERLQFERMDLEKTRAGEKLSKDEQKERKRLATQKVRVLKIVFQAMANLLFFFESVAAHKELQELFDGDIIDLLGLKVEKQDSGELEKGKPYPIFFKPEVFRRLMRAMLAVKNQEEEGFRLSLPYIMQQIILEKVGQQDIPDNDTSVTRIMLDDLNRAVAWTKLYASEAVEEDTSYRRAIGYSLNQNYPGRSYKDEFDHYGRIL